MPSDPPRYSVSMNPLVTARFLALNRLSKAAGILRDWDGTVRRILDRLENDPVEAGDPFRRYVGLKLTAFRLLIDRVSVRYTVHDTERIVFLQSVDPVLGHPLEGIA